MAAPAAAALAQASNPITRAANQVSDALQAFPPFVATLVLAAGALVLAAVLYLVLARAAARWGKARHAAVGAFVARTQGLLFWALAIALLSGVAPAAPLSVTAQFVALHALSAAFFGVLGWAALVAIDVLSEHQISRQSKNIQTDVMARKHTTQWQVLRRVSHMLIVLLTLAMALMAFPAVRKYGVSLLASAGAAGIVLGLAARPVLSNLIAGIQLALTQPLRIEDAVVINGQWGWIEEITATYIVVRIWNWQRMIVPLAWLLEQPFENWTRANAELIGTVHWNVDYTVPVDALRRKLDEIVRATPLWSGKVAVLQVTHALAGTMELRALVSANDSGQAWDLRCLVREKMIAFLQQDYPQALPRQRIEIDAKPAAAELRPRARDEAARRSG